MLVYIQLFINIYNCLCIAYTDNSKKVNIVLHYIVPAMQQLIATLFRLVSGIHSVIVGLLELYSHSNIYLPFTIIYELQSS